MKRNGILNSDISRVLSGLGHTDRICICDCGLPVPAGVERIDLSLKFGVPSFLEVLAEVAKDMKVEQIILAEELSDQGSELPERIDAIFNASETGFKKEYVSHQQFKEMTKDCKAIIRTGDTTAYANIILQSGCIF